MKSTRKINQPRPLSFSLSRLKSAAAIAATLLAAGQTAKAITIWEGSAASGIPGDGFLWTNPNNWSFDTFPVADDLSFGTAPTAGVIILNGNQTSTSLDFTDDYTLGTFGTSNVLTNTSGNVTVASGALATINAALGGTSGLNLSGGGTLFLNHPSPGFAGGIFVDGAGTTLLHRQEGPGPHYNAVNSSQEFGRFDQATLGYSTATRTITLSNGGTYKIINTGNNSEGNYKNLNIGTGGGTLDLGAGFVIQNLDDVNQIGSTIETFTKAGKGRLILTGALADANPLSGGVVIDGGMLSIDRLQGGSTTAGTRFAGINSGANLTVNAGGTIFFNNGTQGRIDIPTITLNNGSILAFNGNDHIVGLDAGGATLNVNGTAAILMRDLFGVQTERLPRFRTDIAGSGTLVVLGNTNSGGNPRFVVERGSGSTFTGTFRLVDNVALEGNPRFNSTVDVGKVIADGDIEFAGFASRLDLRDSDSAAANIKDYTTNELLVSTTQAGSVSRIVIGRATAATGTGHMFNFGTLSIGNSRLAIEGNNGYLVGLADTANINGDATIESRSAPLVFNNAVAVQESVAGRTLTLAKNGVGSAGAVDVTSQGLISLSNLHVTSGTLALRGANGAIGLGAGGTAPTITVNGGTNFGSGGPTFGTLVLDNNGTVLGVTAANNGNRIVDSATLNLRGNSVLRLVSLNNVASTETIGTTNISGHGLIDITKTGTSPTPVALTLSALNLTGTLATANFTGTALGTAGNNTSRIVIPGTASGPLGAQFHSGNEWAKYDATVNSGFEIGVTPFVAADYTSNTAEATWAAGQQIKYTVGGTFLTGNRTVARMNLQLPANNAINLNGNILTLAQGGLISGANAQALLDSNGAFPTVAGGVTAGTTTPSQLYIHNNGTFDIKVPIIDNLGANLAIGGGDDSAVDFVKSGTGVLRLTHQTTGIGVGATNIAMLPDPTWSSTFTGRVAVNDGILEVHRGAYLNGRPIILNGGALFINEPVLIANSGTIVPNWNNNVTVNGNASLVFDDNGESTDINVGGAALIPFGTLAINNGSTLSFGSFGNGQAPVAALNLTGAEDAYFSGGTTISGGRATFNLGVGRTGTTSSLILGGTITGNGFDVQAFGGAPSTLVIGGGVGDAANNTYSDPVVVYGGILRMNKANGATSIANTGAAEDLIINGGTVGWGPGEHGDLVTNNNFNLNNNAVGNGIVPTTPAATKNAGANQIADGASVTLLTGTFGEGDRINNETFNNFIQRNGTFNVGLGTIAVNSATISGGAFGIDRGGAFRVGTLTLQPGAPDLNITTGLPAAGGETTLEIGAGGVSFSGQNIVLGTGSSGNVAGSGAVLRLNGNVTVVGSDLLGGSYSRKGIYVQLGNSFRELGNSRIDLGGGVRDFNIDQDVIFTVTTPLANGGITKSGGGQLTLENYLSSTFAGPVTINAGVINARAADAFGTSAGGVTINSGGTAKLDSGWTYGDNFTVSGPGALLTGGEGAREVGALVAVSGYSRLTGGVAISGNTSIAGDVFLDPSVAPGAGGLSYRIGTLAIVGPTGVTGSGNLNLSGHGDGLIANGINLAAGGVIKDGAGRWTLTGAGAYTGPTSVSAGLLRIANGGALGSAATGTTVFGGGALELVGGISVAEPLSLRGDGFATQSGAVVNVSGSNTLTGAIAVESTTIRSSAGTLTVNGAISGSAVNLTLSGAGAGIISTGLNLGAPASGDVLTKNGTGTWRLLGANTIAGSTTVNGGLLEVGGAGAGLDPTRPLNLGGGNVLFNGSAKSVNGLNLLSGGSSVASGGAGVSVGAIAVTPGATVSFAGNVGTTSTNTNGILGSYATVGSDWASVNAGSIVALSGGSYVDMPLAAATDNAARSLFHVATAASTVNTLKIGGGTGLSLGANNLTLGAGGLIYSNARPGAITGTGLLSGVAPTDNLTVHVTGGTLDIAAPIIGADIGGLVKTGPGTLVVSGTSSFTGGVTVNGGTLALATTPGFPGILGAAVVGGNRLINVNGGTVATYSDWDLNDWDGGTGGVQSFQFNIGSAGGTLRTELGANLLINDGSATPGVATQLMGSGDLVFSGGGRYTLSGGTPQFLGFTGNTTVESGILTLGHSNSLGGRAEQTITLKPGSAIINNTGFGLGQNGLPNNIIAEGGVEFMAAGGNRVYSGDIQLAGTNTIALFEPNVPGATNPINQERQLYFNGRVSGNGITLNVFGSNNGNPFYLASGANTFTGAINLNPNAIMEVRSPGSLGVNTGDVTVNLNGANSRLLLRNFENGDYKANVNVNHTAEINSDRLTGYGAGANQLLSINNLSFVGGDRILTFNGGNGYATRVAGTATFNGDAIVNTINANVIFENGINFAGGSVLDKRGAGVSLILNGPSNHTGATLVQQGFLILQGTNGSLPNTSEINLLGGELRVDNSSFTNPDRLNNAAAINLGGGTLRITGAETIGTVTARSGTTSVIYNPTSETVASALTLTGFTRQTGAVVQFQSPDLGITTVGAGTFGQARVSSRILIPGQADVIGTTNTIPGLLGNNNVDFIQYDGTTIDNGQPLGVRDTRNPGNNTATFAVPYVNDTAETGWNENLVLRSGTAATVTLTAARALDAWKVEQVVTLNQGAFNLRIENGGILAVGNASTINGTTGALYAGASSPAGGIAELFIGGNNTLNVNSIISDNPESGQQVALVKTGTGTLSLGGTTVNTFTGGTFVTAGVLNTTKNSAFGSSANTIYLTGGTLQMNIATATNGAALGGLGQSIAVGANSLIILDNGAGPGIDADYAFGGVTISGPYTLGVRGFDSEDVTFSGTHIFTGTPTIDLPQAGSGSNPNTAGAQTFVTFAGEITGSGFYISSSANTNDTAARLQIGGGAGDASPNTYSGKVTVLLGSNSEDTFVELNKAAGVDAITGDLEINGGHVLNNFDNQIADTANLLINQGEYHANGKNETIASITQRGGTFRTNASNTTPANTVTITGDYILTGVDDLAGAADGFAINSQSTVQIGGTFRMGPYGKGTVGATNGVLILNNLEMAGSVLTQNASGNSTIRLNGDVTTLAASGTARLGNNTTSSRLELNGTRTFNIADGAAGLDFSVSTSMVNGASAGGFTKNGAGSIQLEGSGNVNSYSGPTTINAGTVILWKNAGISALGDGSATNTLTLGDGAGGAGADRLIIRNSNQISDGTSVAIASSGLLDLDMFNTSEAIGNLSGSVGSAIVLGPNSVLTVNSTTDTTYSGSIDGNSTFTKQGSALLYLDGNTELNVASINVDGGTLNVDSDVNNAQVTVNATANFGVDQLMTSLTIGAGGVVTLGDLPGPPPAPIAEGGDLVAGGAIAGGADLVGPAAVPEPGVASLLMLGALGLFGRRRAKKS